MTIIATRIAMIAYGEKINQMRYPSKTMAKRITKIPTNATAPPIKLILSLLLAAPTPTRITAVNIATTIETVKGTEVPFPSGLEIKAEKPT
ncbi:MAG: hypothetical protein J6Y74_03050 [Clostridia bacterium]|nr:hypothetical protein [Clostridia bacterium]